MSTSKSRVLGWALASLFFVSASEAAPKGKLDRTRRVQPSTRGVAVKRSPVVAKPDVVRRSVRKLLQRSASFRSLPASERRALRGGMEVVGRAVLQAELQGRPAGFARRADFPDFVAALIQGTFQAVVDASVEQMKAYGDLVDEVSESVDEFGEEGKRPSKHRKRALAKARRKLKARPLKWPPD
ncbi:MAG: hypothetical protein GY812_16340 [Actinomycetia bacterium]|nr:hypothetical protein [Actinomycetes bacterium]